MRYVPGNAQDVGARTEQQDAFGFSDPNDVDFVAHGGFLGVVADGMGGMRMGGEASRIAVDAFLFAYMRKAPQESIQTALSRAIQAANMAVLAWARQRGVESESGTTLAAAVVADRRLYWISAGDSRVYLIRGNQATRVTTDHVYLNQLMERVAAGRLSLDRAMAHPDREHLTSYLGIPDLQEVGLGHQPVALAPGDRIVICSDGLYKTLSESEVAALSRGRSGEYGERLVTHALSKNVAAQDNITVLSLSCRPDRWSVRETFQAYPGKVTAALVGSILLIAIALGLIWWRGRQSLSDSQQPPSSTALIPSEPAASGQPQMAPDSSTVPPHH